MSDTDLGDIEMDQKALDILSALSDLDGEANTRELRDFLGEMNKGPFHYRLDEYLEPQELVTTHLPDSQPGEFPAKVVSITEVGSEFLEQVDHDAGSDSKITRRVERLEERIESLERENQSLRETNQELQRAVDQSGVGDIQTELRNMKAQVSNLQDQIQSMNQHPVLAHDGSAGAINAGVILGNTCKKLLEQELGEDRVVEKQEEMQSVLTEDGDLIG
jgi:chaperonin cofactor prefoldin